MDRYAVEATHSRGPNRETYLVLSLPIKSSPNIEEVLVILRTLLVLSSVSELVVVDGRIPQLINSLELELAASLSFLSLILLELFACRIEAQGRQLLSISSSLQSCSGTASQTP